MKARAKRNVKHHPHSNCLFISFSRMKTILLKQPYSLSARALACPQKRQRSGEGNAGASAGTAPSAAALGKSNVR
jgi:hypothetical protein